MKNMAEQISDEKYKEGMEIERTSKQYTRACVPSDIPLKILDVGCGTGVNAKELAAGGHSITGIDISSVAIEKFREAGFEGHQCDITQGFPFPEDSFDVVYASEVIEHVVDTAAFFSETFRVLRPCGKLVLSTPNSSFWVYRLFVLAGKTVTDVQHPGHVRFFSKKGLEQFMTKAGYENIDIAGRHIFLILAGRMAEALAPLLERIGFKRELRFRTETWFWFLGGFSTRASRWWADTLIATAHKPKR
jgi:2-polyprenyl-3-methyl-5-hydroxy-6-metoxy-1,4-benzoquinol methylase